jgi:hypothetical protein
VDSLEVLGTDLGNILLDTVEEFLNMALPLAFPPIAIGVGCPTGSFEGEVSNFVLRDLQDGDVSFEVAANPSNPTRSAIIFLSLKSKKHQQGARALAAIDWHGRILNFATHCRCRHSAAVSTHGHGFLR